MTCPHPLSVPQQPMVPPLQDRAVGCRVPSKADFRLPLSAPEVTHVSQLCEVPECLWTQTRIVPRPWSYSPSLTGGKVPSTAAAIQQKAFLGLQTAPLQPGNTAGQGENSATGAGSHKSWDVGMCN